MWSLDMTRGNPVNFGLELGSLGSIYWVWGVCTHLLIAKLLYHPPKGGEGLINRRGFRLRGALCPSASHSFRASQVHKEHVGSYRFATSADGQVDLDQAVASRGPIVQPMGFGGPGRLYSASKACHILRSLQWYQSLADRGEFLLRARAGVTPSSFGGFPTRA